MARKWTRHIWLFEPLDEPGVVRVDYTKDGPFLCNKILAHRIVHIAEGEDDEQPRPTRVGPSPVDFICLGIGMAMLMWIVVSFLNIPDPSALARQILWFCCGGGAGLLFAIIVNRLLPSGR